MLLEHNKVVYEQAVEYFNSGGKDLLITQDTGTGKSYICVELLNTIFKGKKVLYVVPKWSIADNFKGVEGFEGVEGNLRFATYSSFNSYNVVDAYLSMYDIFILDESHHIGSELQGKFAVELLNKVKCSKDKYVLGLTATPMREDKLDVSCYFSKVIQGITLFECIKAGLMNPFEYIICSNTFIDDYRRNIRRNTLSINGESLKFKIDFKTSEDFMKLVIKDNPRDKWICFFQSYQDLCDNKDLLIRLFPEYTFLEVHSFSEESFSIESINKLNKVVILSIDILLEGVHIPNIEGVILFRNVGSLLVFKQILGRITSIGKKDTKPIVLDCTSVAYRMAVMLQYIDKGKEANPRKFYEHSNDLSIFNVDLNNKKYYDINEIILQLSFRSMPFEYKGEIFTSLAEVCRKYDWKLKHVSLWCKRHGYENYTNAMKCEVYGEYINSLQVVYKGKLYKGANIYGDIAKDENWVEKNFTAFRSIHKKECPFTEYKDMVLWFCNKYEKVVSGVIQIVEEGVILKFKSWTGLCLHFDWDAQNFLNWLNYNYTERSYSKAQEYVNNYKEYLFEKNRNIGFYFEGRYYLSYDEVCEKNNWLKQDFLQFRKGKKFSSKEDACKKYKRYLENLERGSKYSIQYKGKCYDSLTPLCNELEINKGSFHYWLTKLKGVVLNLNGVNILDEFIEEYFIYLKKKTNLSIIYKGVEYKNRKVLCDKLEINPVALSSWLSHNKYKYNSIEEGIDKFLNRNKKEV